VCVRACVCVRVCVCVCVCECVYVCVQTAKDMEAVLGAMQRANLVLMVSPHIDRVGHVFLWYLYTSFPPGGSPSIQSYMFISGVIVLYPVLPILRANIQTRISEHFLWCWDHVQHAHSLLLWSSALIMVLGSKLAKAWC